MPRAAFGSATSGEHTLAINSALNTSVSSVANASRGINRVAADIARNGVATQGASDGPETESGTEPRPAAVSYAQSVVELKLYNAQAAASVKMIEAVDEMLGALVDEQI